MSVNKWIVCFFAVAALGFGQRIQGEIPFAFQTANERFQPGTYVMEINLGARLVFITPKGSQQQGHVLAMVGTRDVWVTATVVPSRSERELEGDPLTIQAKRGPVTVTIAARLVK